jgi:peptide/nickel transport system ATP-binding protein
MTAARIGGLRVTLPTHAGPLEAVRGVDLQLAPGEMLCLVGESGSGKSMTALAMMGLLPSTAAVEAQVLEVMGQDMRGASEAQWRELRGDRVAMIFQDPGMTLDPVWSIGEQMIEGYRVHRPGTSRQAALARAAEMLTRTGIDRPELRLRQYPHELSGGMRQRVMIASALMTGPGLLIADEPTTALDAQVQAQILSLLDTLKRDLGLAILLITHDLALAARHADMVAVMQSGEIVEMQPRAALFGAPAHPYTRALLSARPKEAALERIEDAPITFAVQDVSVRFASRGGMFRKAEPVHALRQVSLDVPRGGVLGIVGESGSGKSTMARVLLGLQRPDAGAVTLFGRALDSFSRAEMARHVQPVFQDPYSSLNPRRRIADIIRLPLDVHAIGDRSTRDQTVRAMMDRCGLQARLAEAYPAQLSGGQRQRVSIATALVMRPEIVVCDEPTSALDVSVQAQILTLLQELRAEFGLTYVFISHDLAVVRGLADTLAVMRRGEVVEHGPAARVFKAAQHPYTAALLELA